LKKEKNQKGNEKKKKKRATMEHKT